MSYKAGIIAAIKELKVRTKTNCIHMKGRMFCIFVLLCCLFHAKDNETIRLTKTSELTFFLACSFSSLSQERNGSSLPALKKYMEANLAKDKK